MQVAEPKQLVFSEFGNDPEFSELLEICVAELNCRAEALESHLEEEDWDSIWCVARHLKNTSKSYGFREVSQEAAKLETTCLENRSQQTIRESVEEVIALCNRVRPGSPERW